MCTWWHLIDSDRVDLPVCIGKVHRVVADEVHARVEAACACILWAISELTIDLACPCAAEVYVDDNAHVCEMLIDIATALVVDSRCSKGRDIGRAVGNTRRYLTTRKEPGLEVGGCPFGSIYSATIRIESIAIVVRNSGIG